MTLVIGFLTLVLILISVFLVLLVLVQLPKKEAGVGMAFGAGMSEMLLGAGSGNVLTRITKYTVGIYLALALILSVLISHNQRARGLNFSRALEEKARAGQTPVPTPSPGLESANSGLQSLIPTATNADPAVTPQLISTTTVVNPTPAPAPTDATPTPQPEPQPPGN